MFGVEPGMNFGEALEHLKKSQGPNARITRPSWKPEEWVVRIYPGNAMHISHFGGYAMQVCLGLKSGLYMFPGWTPSQEDMFAEDWETLPEPA